MSSLIESLSILLIHIRTGELDCHILYDIHSIKKNGEVAKPMPSSDIFLLHYDCTRFEEWVRMWDLREKCYRLMNPSPKRLEQGLRYYEARKKGKEELLKIYKDIYFIPDEDKRKLKELSCFRRFVFPREIFEIR